MTEQFDISTLKMKVEKGEKQDIDGKPVKITYITVNPSDYILPLLDRIEACASGEGLPSELVNFNAGEDTDPTYEAKDLLKKARQLPPQAFAYARMPRSNWPQMRYDQNFYLTAINEMSKLNVPKENLEAVVELSARARALELVYSWFITATRHKYGAVDRVINREPAFAI